MFKRFAQKITLGYYQTKFNTLGAISPVKAANAAFTLFCTPYHGKPKRKAPGIFNKAVKQQVIFEGLTMRGFQWKPAKSTGKRFLICHGFDSSCYKFAPFVAPLLEKGFEVVAFDAAGHGVSDGETINALQYSRFILQLEEQYGPFDVLMAHSLGALALSIAIEQMANQQEKKLVLIAPATETSSALNNFFHMIPVSFRVRKAFEQKIVDLGGKPIQWYSVTRAVQNIQCKILWLHDKADPICSFEDTKIARQLKLPHIQFLITNNLGHSNIYKEPAIQKAIVDFSADDHFSIKKLEALQQTYEWI